MYTMYCEHYFTQSNNLGTSNPCTEQMYVVHINRNSQLHPWLHALWIYPSPSLSSSAARPFFLLMHNIQTNNTLVLRCVQNTNSSSKISLFVALIRDSTDLTDPFYQLFHPNILFDQRCISLHLYIPGLMYNLALMFVFVAE